MGNWKKGTMTSGEGFEPSQTESESVVLPLHYPESNSRGIRYSEHCFVSSIPTRPPLKNYRSLFLWRFFLSFFLRLWVAIFFFFLLRPQGTLGLLLRMVQRLYHQPGALVNDQSLRSAISTSGRSGWYHRTPGSDRKKVSCRLAYRREWSTIRSRMSRTLPSPVIT